MFSVILGLSLCYYLALVFFTTNKPSLNPSINLDPKKVEIAVSIFNGEKDIPSFLNSLKSFVSADQKIHFCLNGCTDNSEELLREFCALHFKKARISLLPQAHKKKAINLIADSSTAEYLLLLDVDVELDSDFSIDEMICGEVDLMLYPLNLRVEKGSFLSRILEIEWDYLQLLTHSLRGKNQILGNAAAMLCKTEHLKSNKAYKDNLHIPTGDDIFLIEYLQHRGGVIRSHDKVIGVTEGVLTWRDFYKQRIRWSSKNYSLKGIQFRVASFLFFLRFILPYISALGCLMYGSALYVLPLLLLSLLELSRIPRKTGVFNIHHLFPLLFLPFIYLPVLILSFTKSLSYR